MNMLERETLRVAAQRGQPGGSLLRGLIWAMIAIFIISVVIFLLTGGDPGVRHYTMLVFPSR